MTSHSLLIPALTLLTLLAPAAAQEIRLGMSADSQSRAPLLATFEASVPQGLRVRWIFGDGQQAEGLKVTHTFYRPAEYVVQAQILDARGNTVGSGQLKVKVLSGGAEKAELTVLLGPKSVVLGAQGSVSYAGTPARFWLDSREVRAGVELPIGVGKHTATVEVPTSAGMRRKTINFNLPSVQTSTAFDLEVIRLTNLARAQGWDCERRRTGGRALPPLQSEARLNRAALAQSVALAAVSFFDHTSALDGSQPHERLGAAGWSPSSSAENIASGQGSPAEVVQAWLASLGHCKNIMGDYTHIGVGVVMSKGQNSPFWTQLFARP